MSIEAILDRKTRDFIAANPTATLKNAADQMLKHGTGALIVTRGDAVAGIVSEREIVHAVARHGEPALAIPVINIVAPGIVSMSITPSDSVKKAMRLMMEHRVRLLPVIADGKLIGVVSLSEVITQRLVDLEMESNVLRDAYIAAH
jgi:CBS domain-containing protein